MRGTTGHPCPKSGIWRSLSNCHSVEIALSVGETFPPCRYCRAAVTWILIQPTHN